MTDQHHATFTIGANHPAMPGHFPGRPIVPGVILLDHVIATARDAFGLGPNHAVPRAKFATPVLPGQSVAVALTRMDNHRLTFTCSVEGTPVASGELRFGS